MIIDIINFSKEIEQIETLKNIKNNFNQNNIFWSFIDSEDFSNNFNDKMILTNMYNIGNSGFNEILRNDKEYGSYFINKMQNQEKYLSKEYSNFDCFKYPLISYLAYKNNNLNPTIEHLEKSIRALENMFDKGIKDALPAKIEQTKNIFKANLVLNNFKYISEKLEKFLSELNLDSSSYYFRPNEIDFLKNYNSVILKDFRDNVIVTLFFANNKLKSNVKNDFFCNLIIKEYKLFANEIDCNNQEININRIDGIRKLPFVLQKYFLEKYIKKEINVNREIVEYYNFLNENI